MDIQPIILAGGKGTRMESDLPKVLVNLKGKPLLEYVLSTVEKVTDIEKPIIVVGYEKEKIIDLVGDRAMFAIQGEQLGTGHAVFCAIPKVNAESILVMYGDMPFITKSNIEELIKRHNNSRTVLTMVTISVGDYDGEKKNFERYGRVIRENGRVIKTVEYRDADEETKAIIEVTPSYFVINTNWFKEAYKKITSNNAAGEYYLPDVVKIAIDEGRTIETVTLPYENALGANTKEELEVLEKVFDRIDF